MNFVVRGGGNIVDFKLNYIYALCGLDKVPRIVEVLDIPNANK